MTLDWKQELDDKSDILNFWNFPKGLGLKVKVGTFLPIALQGQQLSLSEQLTQWPKIYSEVSYDLFGSIKIVILTQYISK